MKNKRLLPIMCSILISVFVSFLIGTCLRYHPDHPSTALEEGWTVSINDKTSENVVLFDFYKIMDGYFYRGDEIVMTITLPDIGDVPFPALLFRSRYTTLTCYVDGVKIYDFGKDLYQNRKFIGKMYHFIPLPYDYAGKELKMEMTVSENNAFTSLRSVKLGSQPDIEMEFINDHLMIITTGMFLIIFGIAFLCITMFYVFSVPAIKSFVVGSLFCINLGFWIMTYYNVLSPFLYTPYETQIEYATLYLIVPFCYLLVYFIEKVEKKKIYITLGLFSCVIVATQYIMHYLFNIHLRETLSLYHITGIMGFGLIIYFIIKNVKKKDLSASEAIQMTGLVAFASAEIFHLILYTLDTMHIKTSDFFSMLVIDSGCLIFAMSQLSNYMLFITQAYAQRQEYASLSRLAYADGLTNLPNRAKTDKILEDLNNIQTDYCIISIDLNGLKPVNDKFGHLSGDKYIKDFSKVLSSSFDNDSFCSRIGGDEFLVIIKDAEGKDIESMIGRMNSALNVMNALYTEYRRSVAAGYAFKHERPDGNSHDVYLLADERMYEIKRRMHKELGITGRV